MSGNWKLERNSKAMVQIIPQTKEEKIAMYMKCTKKQLAEMLWACNVILDPPIQQPTEPGIYISGGDWEGYEITHVYGRQTTTGK